MIVFLMCMFQIMIKEEERLAAVIDDIDHDVRIVPRAAYVKTPTGQVYNNRSFEGIHVLWSQLYRKVSIFPYHFLNPNNVQIWVGGWFLERWLFRFRTENKTVRLDLKEKWRKKCFVLFQTTFADYCFAKAVHSRAKLRTANCLSVRSSVLPSVRPSVSCPTPHVNSFETSGLYFCL